jgi:hypothetical protein
MAATIKHIKFRVGRNFEPIQRRRGKNKRQHAPVRNKIDPDTLVQMLASDLLQVAIRVLADSSVSRNGESEPWILHPAKIGNRIDRIWRMIRSSSTNRDCWALLRSKQQNWQTCEGGLLCPKGFNLAIYTFFDYFIGQTTNLLVNFID